MNAQMRQFFIQNISLLMTILTEQNKEIAERIKIQN